MAWTEQCKIAFKVSADAKYWKAGNKGIIKILKELSKESDIPFNTLRNWYYEKDPRDIVTENGNKSNSEQNQEDNNNTENDMATELPLCSRCGEYRVRVHSGTKKPYSEKSKYYGLCPACSRLKVRVENNKNVFTRCPKCRHEYKLTESNVFCKEEECQE